jgi:hypothetical protein
LPLKEKVMSSKLVRGRYEKYEREEDTAAVQSKGKR